MNGINTMYTFNFAQTLPAPSFKETLWSLTAVERISFIESPAADRPNRKVEVKCEIPKLK